ncbi:PKD domain-containing protein [Saccharothrix sp. S26]|uniref:PKD domain-containing protein n=1 Tax=Saccharothrix sp. S26 TaxID=2907215 RepID=UPI001F2ACD16|nr:right-handed parallel beta-helix repeat-containing protein [Saccharothrix sp. S26]MCE6998442.1 PKD domain-containing protein [Saccharothrix sp. S26]
MRLPNIAAAAAFAVFSGVVWVPVAQAVPTTLYVTDTAACSDDGDGSAATPFCTVQAAADVVAPGQVVKITGTHDESVTITRSGTADAPVVFEGGGVRRPAGGTAPTITVRGAHDVTLRDMTVHGATVTDAVVVDAAGRVTLDRGSIQPDADPYGGADSVRVTGGSTDVTISRTTYGTRGRAVYADGGARLTVTGNVITSLGNYGVIAEGVDAIAVTGNTFRDSCRRGIAVTGATTGSSIQNNVITEVLSRTVSGYCPPDRVHAIEVDSAAAPGVTLDYNVAYLNVNVYRWAGATYQTPADLHAATGQGAHDLKTDPYQGTAVVDSGNAAAPGVLDQPLGGPRVDNPQVPNTGAGPITYLDRGAKEQQDQFTGGTVTASATQAPVGGAVTVGSTLQTRWGSPVTCAVDFGDGTTTSVSPCSTSHAYQATGTYTIKVTATTESKLTWSTSSSLKVVPAGGALNPSLTASADGGMTAYFTVDSGGDPWNIAGTSIDFGDGKTATVGTAAQHRYDRPGTYQVRATVTDAAGATATTSTSFTTLGSGYVKHGPTRLLDTRSGVGAPARKVAPYGTVRLAVGGRDGIPADVTAVAVNLTVTDATADGHLTAHPSGQARPTASVIDFRAGATVPGLTTVAVGDGHVDLYNGSPGTVDVIADVAGYFTKAASAEGFTPIRPQRLLDTRTGLGMPSPRPIAAGETFSQRVAGHYTGGVPSYATAALVNITVADPRAAGHLTAFPAGTPNPQTSNLNYTAGQITTNSVIAPIGSGGYVDLYSNATTDVVIDVVGYFAPGNRSFLLPGSPLRAVDTRTGLGGPAGALPGRSTTEYALDQGAPPLRYPPTAVMSNAKVVTPQRDGYLTAYSPSPVELRPDAATLNFTAGAVTNNLAVTQHSSAAFHNGSDGDLDLVVDVTGYFYDY